MATEYQVENRTLYIRLDGELDHHLAKKVRKQCEIILKSYPIRDIEFDFSKSGFMDSSGGNVFLSHMNESVKRIAYMAGLHQIMKEK